MARQTVPQERWTINQRPTRDAFEIVRGINLPTLHHSLHPRPCRHLCDGQEGRDAVVSICVLRYRVRPREVRSSTSPAPLVMMNSCHSHMKRLGVQCPS